MPDYMLSRFSDKLDISWRAQGGGIPEASCWDRVIIFTKKLV